MLAWQHVSMMSLMSGFSKEHCHIGVLKLNVAGYQSMFVVTYSNFLCKLFQCMGAHVK